jgi:hypothetical protein
MAIREMGAVCRRRMYVFGDRLAVELGFAHFTLAIGECLSTRARIIRQDCARRFSQAR